MAAFDGGTVTSAAGAMLLRQTDWTIKLVDRFAPCVADHRSADRIEHSLGRLVLQRVYGITR